ncbi:MAG: hypothetical protein ACT4NY_16430 [Pseudonocardiales bacterium]
MMQDLAKRMGERMISSGELVRGLLGGAQWVGAAATAAGQAMQRGADQIDQTAANALTAERCVTELGESFVGAQHRVPSPNEIPSGLGDKFVFGVAEGFNVVSPFDVQSPIHAAMEQRRELDEQANQALTNHMTTSRERLDTIPTVAPPPPMTVSTQSASASGGGVGYPAGGVPVNVGGGGAPASTAGASWGGGAVSAAPPVGPGPGPVSPGAPGPVGTPPAVVGPGYRPHPSGPGQLGPTAARPGQVPFAPGFGGGGRVGETARGPGSGARPGAGVPGRGAPGLGAGPGPGGGPVPGGSVDSARGGGSGRGGGPAGGRGAAGHASFLQPPIGGRSQGGEDTEHKDRYAQHADHIVGKLPLVAPAVIGETPEEEAIRLRRAQEER